MGHLHQGSGEGSWVSGASGRDAGRSLGTAGDRVRGGSSGDRHDAADDGHHGEGCPGDKLIVQM